MSLVSRVEEAVGSSEGILKDDRSLPLFQLVRRVGKSTGSVRWLAKVVDEGLLAEGAPAEVELQATALSGLESTGLLTRVLENCLVDHPHIQLCHSAALPLKRVRSLQPEGAPENLPPLHWLPLCDELPALLLVKEPARGGSLSEWLGLRGRELQLAEILSLVETLAGTLSALHRRGFPHGALTPESFVMQAQGEEGGAGSEKPKLVDIGLSRLLAVPGTFPAAEESRWCAPEAFGIDPQLDWALADQFSIAAMLYSLWTDEPPFDEKGAGVPASEARARRRRQIEVLPPPRSSLRARELGVTPALSAVCMRALSIEPAERYGSIEAFAAALRQAGRESEGTEPNTTNPGPFLSSRFRSVPPPARRSDSAQWPSFDAPVPQPVVREASVSGTAAIEQAPPFVPDRSTRILLRPAELEGEIPEHPDVEEARALELRPDAQAVSDLESALGPGKWAFNHLSALLLVLWLLTLGWALWG